MENDNYLMAVDSNDLKMYVYQRAFNTNILICNNFDDKDQWSTAFIKYDNYDLYNKNIYLPYPYIRVK